LIYQILLHSIDHEAANCTQVEIFAGWERKGIRRFSVHQPSTVLEYRFLIKTENMNRFLTTLLAGVAIGMLIAPEKGSVIRQRITDLWEDLQDALSNGVHNVESRIEDTAERVDSTLREQVS
jgi:hypothetical protein